MQTDLIISFTLRSKFPESFHFAKKHVSLNYYYFPEETYFRLLTKKDNFKLPPAQTLLHFSHKQFFGVQIVQLDNWQVNAKTTTLIA